MMGYVQRMDATTLEPAGGSCADGSSVGSCLEGTNSITAQLANGLLWITQFAGGDARNYCGRTADGSAIAPIRLPRPTADQVLAIGARWIYYAAPGRRQGSTCAASLSRRAAATPPASRPAVR